MGRDEVEVHKDAKRERGQYPAILTELALSIKDLLYGIKNSEKMIFVLVYFRPLKRKPVICKSDVLLSLFSFSLALSVFSFSSSIREITKSLFTATANILQKKTFVHPLGLRRNFIAGTKRAIPSGQYRPSLPARVASPLAELAIIIIIIGMS